MSNPSRQLEVQRAGDVEIGLQSTDAGGHLWTLQRSRVAGDALDATFQIIDRTLGFSRLAIDLNGHVGIGSTEPKSRLMIVNSGHVWEGASATQVTEWLEEERSAERAF